MSSASNYKALTQEISSNTKQLRASQPEVMQGFNAMSKAALAPGAIDAKTKELIALGIGVAARCDGCIGFHTQALARLGATRTEVHETLAIAVYMGGGPALMYAANAVAAFDQAAPEQVPSATA
ncbi:MAG: carboxymuconolactone decarboxylase family protein [Proteobacteria bacterium]|nr:carboxymuconolactone decarboxylase family protein [Pseudomonadota bacterium]